ncbi:MAG TPA: protein phosphatase 2C domain-containing protein [Candidatus Hydrogenedentes bacterium]|nr:protein phosphatase 2C domain-containing protein [Candidatus Hydrogenedentota bacterium]HRT19894.1 protein phosphatase 2C domain-containing protein [Candidatus Hydrogenedentota bacterium]HRT65474.1 protein phosphatase 2C domain-containing protein [Candidatus Hydrogenedentota bacterium]
MRRFDVYGLSNRGKVRAANEDHILLYRQILNNGSGGLAFKEDDPRLRAPGMLFAAADGIGGLAAGADASRIGLVAFEAHYRETDGGETGLRAAGIHANRAILDEAARFPDRRGMGCTLAGVCLMDGGYLVFHAGDSRVYRIRNGFAKQLTVDDTVAQRAVEAGLFSPDEAQRMDARHTVTNSAGSPSFVLHVAPGPEWRDGDALLVCTDGLHDLIGNDAIEEAAAEGSAETRARRLMETALQAGGHDNISVIIIGTAGADI